MAKGAGNEQVALAMAEVSLDGREAPKRVRLLPIGSFTLRDGRGTFIVKDRTHAERIVAATRAYAGGQQLPFDYDHQSVFGAKDGVGGQAPAAGWITDYVIEDDGIYGLVDWTPRAAAQIVDKEYRYISPYFGFDKTTHEVTRIFNSSLTNTPAIDGLEKLAASLNPLKEPDMDLTALAASLGLPATATLAECIAASNARNGRLTAALGALGLEDSASQEAIITASANVRQIGADEKVVPAAVFAELQTEVKTLKADKVAASVDAYVKAGKITPAQRPGMLKWATSDFAAFEEHMTASTVIVDPNATSGDEKKAGAGADSLTAEQRTVCSTLGLDPAAYLETLKAEGTN